MIERGSSDHEESSEIDSKIGLPAKGKKTQNVPVDLRHILGFLNQTEWI